jgi:hypothetical protein
MPSNGHAASYKEVRFSQSVVPIRRARSVASSKPLLDSAHQAKRTTSTLSKRYNYAECAVYLGQSRSLLDSQRLNFERERAAFADERRLWAMERALLKSRIAELELPGEGSAESKLAAPKLDHLTNNNQDEHHVWEGPIVGATRVFPDETRKPNLYIPHTEANGFGLRSSLDAALSPQAFDRTTETSVPVPIEKVDSELDGITLKSTALPPEVVAKVMTPPTSISPTSSPPRDESLSEGRIPLKLTLSDLGPPGANLTRDAGHTPMVILGTETETSGRSPTDIMDPENPLEPVTTTQQPAENSESYFPAPDEDPALKGPLTLPSETDTDSTFLLELDQKLLDEAKKAVSSPSRPGVGDDEEGGENEPDPELKLKDATNFGTAFGVSECGRI